MCVICTPAAAFKSSRSRLPTVATPVVPQVALPGLFLAWSTNSSTLFHGAVEFTTRTIDPAPSRAIDVNPLIGSNGTGLKTGAFVKMELFIVPRVYPSGLELARKSAPITPPPPPALYSTSIRVFSSFSRLSLRTRVTTSFPEPGPSGMMIFIGLDGYLSWAEAVPKNAAAIRNTTKASEIFFIVSLLLQLSDRFPRLKPPGRAVWSAYYLDLNGEEVESQ